MGTLTIAFANSTTASLKHFIFETLISCSVGDRSPQGDFGEQVDDGLEMSSLWFPLSAAFTSITKLPSSSRCQQSRTSVFASCLDFIAIPKSKKEYSLRFEFFRSLSRTEDKFSFSFTFLTTAKTSPRVMSFNVLSILLNGDITCKLGDKQQLQANTSLVVFSSLTKNKRLSIILIFRSVGTRGKTDLWITRGRGPGVRGPGVCGKHGVPESVENTGSRGVENMGSVENTGSRNFTLEIIFLAKKSFMFVCLKCIIN